MTRRVLRSSQKKPSPHLQNMEVTTRSKKIAPSREVSSSPLLSPPKTHADTNEVQPPSALARLTCVSILVGILAIWGKFTFVYEQNFPGGTKELHSWKVPMGLNVMYLVSLPLLRMFSSHFLSKKVDVKLLLRESMILYNAAQVVLNGWMVYKILVALAFHGHPIIGGGREIIGTGASYAVWVHYCDKYLEFLDTYFMVLRGRMDQVSFLHVYHHTSISLCWWYALKIYPGGDAYFGALLNSWIHVMMYSYYTFSLLKIPCPWKKYLTQAQLLQFATVMIYSVLSIRAMPTGADWTMYSAHVVQDFEMSSLFILFMHFYRKAYLKKRRDYAERRALKEAAEAESESPTKEDSDAASDTVAEQASISSESSLDENSS